MVTEEKQTESFQQAKEKTDTPLPLKGIAPIIVKEGGKWNAIRKELDKNSITYTKAKLSAKKCSKEAR